MGAIPHARPAVLVERLEPTLPLWARAADVAASVFAFAAASIYATGGLRELTPLGRVSMTSWPRPAALAILLLVVRHLRHPPPSIPHRLPSALAGWVAAGDARAVWPVFVSTRVGIVLVGFFGIAMVGYAPGTPPWRTYANDFYNLPARWDTGWYLSIAEHGYVWHDVMAGRMQNIAFFPAYPLLIRAATPFVGGQPMAAAVGISFGAFFFLLCYLFGLARGAIGDDRAATAVALLAAYPFALFFSTAYTESLFLLAAVGACYHFECDELWCAAGWGVLAGLARPNGCLLSVVLGLIAVRRGLTARRLAAAAAPGIGLLMFSAYIYSLTGHPLEWAHNHAAYGRTYRSLDLL